MRAFYKSMKTDTKCYTEYIGARMGYHTALRRLAGFANIFLEPMIELYYMESYQKEFICSVLYFSKTDIEACIW